MPINRNCNCGGRRSNPDASAQGLNINYCGAGISCRDASFVQVVGSNQLGGDDGSFYVPFIQDPQAASQLIVGTCRVWRGGPATTMGAYGTLSNNFDSVDANGMYTAPAAVPTPAAVTVSAVAHINGGGTD